VDLNGLAQDSCATTTGEALTAAFAMYQHEYDERGNTGKSQPRLPKAHDMYVVWSNRHNPWNEQHLFGGTKNAKAQKCIPITGGIFNWLYWFGSGLLQGTVLRQGCPYTDTLRAGYLRSHQQDDDVQSRIKGRYVFYGGDLAALGDYINPPTHMRLPAIYLHAMALDNLLAYRGHYKHEQMILDETYFPRRVVDLALFILVMCFVLNFARNRHRATLSVGSPRPKPVRLTFATLTGLAIIVPLLSVYVFTLATESPRQSWMYFAVAVTTFLILLSLYLLSIDWLRRESRPPDLYSVSVIYFLIVAAAWLDMTHAVQIYLNWFNVILGIGALWIIRLTIAPVIPEIVDTNAGRNDMGNWRFLQILWQWKQGWGRFLTNLALVLIALAVALFEWQDIASRNWLGM
jgi:hypothetical protein